MPRGGTSGLEGKLVRRAGSVAAAEPATGAIGEEMNKFFSLKVRWWWFIHYGVLFGCILFLAYMVVGCNIIWAG